VRLHGTSGWSKGELAELLVNYADVEHVSAKKDTAVVTLATASQADHVAAECDLTPYNIDIEHLSASKVKIQAPEQVWQSWEEGEHHRVINVDDGRDATAQMEARHTEILCDVLGEESDRYQWSLYTRLLKEDYTEADAFLLALEATLQACGGSEEEPLSPVLGGEEEEAACPICGDVMKRSVIEAHAWGCLEASPADQTPPSSLPQPPPGLLEALREEASSNDEGGDISWWYYLDDDGVEQGPYPNEDMRSWWEAGYFEPDRSVRIEGASREFDLYPINDLYPNLQDAFTCAPSSVSGNCTAPPRQDDPLGVGDCPFCGLSFPQSLLEAHVAKHIEIETTAPAAPKMWYGNKPVTVGTPAAAAMASCPVCGVAVTVESMDAHVEICLSEAAIREEESPPASKACKSFWGEDDEEPSCSRASTSVGQCPVCELELPLGELGAHVNGHFS